MPRQQPSRERHPALCRGPQELAVFRPPAQGRRLDHTLLPHRDGQGQWHEAIPLPAPPLRALAGGTTSAQRKALLPQ